MTDKQTFILDWKTKLEAAGYEVRQPSPYHLQILTNSGKHDAWPTSGKWRVGSVNGVGINSLLSQLSKENHD